MILCGLSSTSMLAQNYDDKFTSEDKKFNDWSISLFAGTNAMQNTDMTTWGRDEGKNWFTPGYDFQFSVNRQITHAFGIALQYQIGKSKQEGLIYDDHTKYYGHANAETNYQTITLLGDVNFSNLLRRTDK